jgi:spermidine synthase
VIAVPVGTVKAKTDSGDRVIYEAETRLQYARVVEEPDGTRKLELNEGVAEHSLFRPGSYLTGSYWDGLLVVPFASLTQVPDRVAVLGNAAGTVSRAYGHYFPAARIDAVEIDPDLAEIGRRYFDMQAPHLFVHDEDARPWLRTAPGDYDVIVLDAYRQPYIPFYLATREFFELARDRLAPGGLVIVNVGHPVDSTELEEVVGRTMAEAFPVVLRDPIEDENTLLLGGERVRPTTFARWRRDWCRSSRRSRALRRPGSGRGCPAARSTPMTVRRSSG